MKNFENFQRYEPDKEKLKELESVDFIPLFLRSDDGVDWYDCIKEFADNTVKLMYDSDGVIYSVVDEPVPERGNIYAVSMFNPENMSVAEIALKDYPEGVSIDGSWMFSEGAVIPVPIDHVAEAEREKTQRLNEAEAAIAPLQRAVKYGIANDDERMRLEAWEIYTVLLSRVDPSQAPNIKWPEKPGESTATTP